MAQRILHRRERAVRRHDEQAFLADVDPSDEGSLSRQRRRFENLVQLPLATYQLDAVGATWPSGFADDEFRKTAYIPYVEEALELRGFDDGPVVQTTGVTFAQVDGRWRIVSDDDVADREADGSRNLPWDLTRIVVRRSPHALGIFDRRSAASADRLMAWTEQSVATVRGGCRRTGPARWCSTRCRARGCCAAMGTRFLDRAAVAFPVLDDVDRPTRRVATRVVINPTYLPQDERAGHLPAHPRDHARGAGARRTGPRRPGSRRASPTTSPPTAATRADWLPTAATVARAREGADAMPGSTFFGDEDPGFEYDLSLGACVYLADRFGEDRLWAFLDRLVARARTDGDAEGNVDPVLRSMFGLDSARLAARRGTGGGRRAAELIARSRRGAEPVGVCATMARFSCAERLSVNSEPTRRPHHAPVPTPPSADRRPRRRRRHCPSRWSRRPAAHRAGHAAPQKPHKKAASNVKLQILALNDFHGQLEPSTVLVAPARINGTPAGGAEYLATAPASKLRAQARSQRPAHRHRRRR